jgi:parallel beta-helix repeat protein
MDDGLKYILKSTHDIIRTKVSSFGGTFTGPINGDPTIILSDTRISTPTYGNRISLTGDDLLGVTPLGKTRGDSSSEDLSSDMQSSIVGNLNIIEEVREAIGGDRTGTRKGLHNSSILLDGADVTAGAAGFVDVSESWFLHSGQTRYFASDSLAVGASTDYIVRYNYSLDTANGGIEVSTTHDWSLEGERYFSIAHISTDATSTVTEIRDLRRNQNYIENKFEILVGNKRGCNFSTIGEAMEFVRLSSIAQVEYVPGNAKVTSTVSDRYFKIKVIGDTVETSAPIFLPTTGVVIEGLSDCANYSFNDAPVVSWDASADHVSLFRTLPGEEYSNIHIKNIHFYQTNVAAFPHTESRHLINGYRSYGFSNCRFENIKVSGRVCDFINLETTDTNYNIWVRGCVSDSIIGDFLYVSPSSEISNVYISDCLFNSSDGYAIYMENAYNVKINNNMFNNFGYGIYLDSTHEATISDNIINNSTDFAVYSTMERTVITGNIFRLCQTNVGDYVIKCYGDESIIVGNSISGFVSGSYGVLSNGSNCVINDNTYNDNIASNPGPNTIDYGDSDRTKAGPYPTVRDGILDSKVGDVFYVNPSVFEWMDDNITSIAAGISVKYSFTDGKYLYVGNTLVLTCLQIDLSGSHTTLWTYAPTSGTIIDVKHYGGYIWVANTGMTVGNREIVGLNSDTGVEVWYLNHSGSYADPTKIAAYASPTDRSGAVSGFVYTACGIELVEYSFTTGTASLSLNSAYTGNAGNVIHDVVCDNQLVVISKDQSGASDWDTYSVVAMPVNPLAGGALVEYWSKTDAITNFGHLLIDDDYVYLIDEDEGLSNSFAFGKKTGGQLWSVDAKMSAAYPYPVQDDKYIYYPSAGTFQARLDKKNGIIVGSDLVPNVMFSCSDGVLQYTVDTSSDLHVSPVCTTSACMYRVNDYLMARRVT